MSTRQQHLLVQNPRDSAHQLSKALNRPPQVLRNIYTNFRLVDQKKLIRICGEQHRYQYFMLISFICMALLQMLFLMTPIFLFLIPEYRCVEKESNRLTTCTLSQACASKSQFIIEPKSYSFKEHYGLLCQASYFSGKVLSLIFISAAGLSAPLFLLINILGRRLTLGIYSMLQIFSCLMLLHVHDLYFSTGLLAILVSVAFIFFLVSFEYLSESSGGVFKVRAYQIFILALALSLVISNPIFKFFQQFQSFIVFLIMAVLCLSFSFMILIESPKYMREVYTLRNFYFGLREIIRINFAPPLTKRRKQALKVLLFDAIDPSIQVISETDRLSDDSISHAISSQIFQVKDDMNISIPSKSVMKNKTSKQSKRQISISKEQLSQENMKMESKPVKIKNMDIQQTIFGKKTTKLVDPKTRKKIYKLKLPFMSTPITTFISWFTFSQLIYSVFFLISSAFLTSFFWFSLQDMASRNPQLNASILSVSFFVGSFLSIVNKKDLMVSLAFMTNLGSTSFLLILDSLTMSFTFQVNQSTGFHYLILPILFVFNLSASFVYISVLRTSILNFRNELKSLIKVLIIFASFMGFSFGAFSSSLLMEYELSLLWGVFIVAVLTLPLSFFFRFKLNEPFSQLQSPA